MKEYIVHYSNNSPITEEAWNNMKTAFGEPIKELVRCKECKFHHDRTQCKKRIGAWFDDDYCNGAVRAERREDADI